MSGDLWLLLKVVGVNVFSSYALGLGALQDLADRTVSRLPLFMLYGLGALQGVGIKRFGLWLLLMCCGALFERGDKIPLGEGDLYMIAGLALLHSPLDVLLMVTLAVWLLFPRTLYALWLKHKGQPYRLPFLPALFAARQIVLLTLILV